CSRERLQLRQELAAEELTALLQQRLSLGRSRIQPGQHRQHAIATHPHQPADVIVADRVSGALSDRDPGSGVRVIAVDERAVDVEQNALAVVMPADASIDSSCRRSADAAATAAAECADARASPIAATSRDEGP